jgi:hypothetical protein
LRRHRRTDSINANARSGSLLDRLDRARNAAIGISDQKTPPSVPMTIRGGSVSTAIA